MKKEFEFEIDGFTIFSIIFGWIVAAIAVYLFMKAFLWVFF